MNAADEMNFYEALQEMKLSKVPFSIVWSQYSLNESSGQGQMHQLDNVMYAGMKNTEHFELIKFRSISDNSIQHCHLYSLYFYNGKKLVINE
ncbi:MAG: hypothetical protein CVU11_13230 [Bacteroidetes bacterium HGW-Bacteroidetes-6]|jgi:hypothetical protein|nr:MAG: hypothetical protein CVU11_13230 [Bacteroidetes bacterium HGW-Bacteroidetes-6]